MAALEKWIDAMATLCRPESVHICEGTEEEILALAEKMIQAKTLVRLDPQKRPNSYWCRSHPDDVARVEEATFICSKKESDSGPTNHWADPAEMKEKLLGYFSGCMQGRIMYVIPYCMGPIDSPYARCGVEITDSPYVVLNMHIMAHIGKEALERVKKESFVKGMHSVGVPLSPGQEDSFWPCDPKRRVITHFPEEKEIWSFGSGYGGNALLGKKCHALRIASSLARSEGWLAEHMLILGLTSPEGVKRYFTAAFPSACGKTNLAMMESTLPGWKVECVGDDIAWMHVDEDGQLYAINPETGYFGVAPGTSMQTNPNAMRTLDKNAIFTNVALTPDLDIWWEGIGEDPKEGMTTWLGERWDPTSKEKAAHPNSRFTASSKQCPIYDPAAQDPKGVPISGIIFGGRRDLVVPLVMESFDWQHGVFYGASVSSQMTAAAKGKVGELRHDPFAMLPFCGYHMGDYFAHWLEMGKKLKNPPKIFYVNWFQKDDEGNFLWPGFGENVRVLKWCFERVGNKAQAKETPLGKMPLDLDVSGLGSIDLERLFAIDPKAWKEECAHLETYFRTFKEKFPEELSQELVALKERLT